MPQLSHSNYRRSINVQVTMGGRTLLHRSVRLTMFWQRAIRVWQGTDQYVNYCIDQSRPVYSSNLRLYCNIPTTLLGKVQFEPSTA